MDMDEKTFKSIIARLEKLEKAVFASSTRKKPKASSSDNHQGASGGVKLLIENNYFAKKRTAVETWQSLKGVKVYANRK